MTAQINKSSSSISIKKNDATTNLQEQIRQRAYELYEQRGRQDGHDVDDWLQSESQVMTNRKTTAVAA